MFKSLKNIQNKIYVRNYSALIPNIKPICLNKYNNIEECKKIINIVNNLNFSNNISANLDISNTNINIEGFFIFSVSLAPKISFIRTIVLVLLPPPPPVRCFESNTYCVIGSDTHCAEIIPTALP